MQKIILSWSGGKDSMLALHKLIHDQRYKVVGLLTTFAGRKHSVKFHFVDENLIRQQAEMFGLPLFPVYIGEKANNKEYIDAHLKKLLELQQQENIEAVAFGDIFLQGIRSFREDMLKNSGLQCVFPLWGKKPTDLLQTFFDEKYRTIITAVNIQQLSPSFAGKELNEQLLRQFPAEADLCGENGEYHTFVFDGPLFRQPVSFLREGKSYKISFKPEYSIELAVANIATGNAAKILS